MDINQDRLKKKRYRERGFSLLSVIFTMLALSAVGAGMASSLSVKSNTTVKNYDGQQAFYVAEGGLQYIFAQHFANDGDFSDNVSPTGVPFGNPSIDLGGGEFWVEYSGLSANSATVTVTSQVGTSVRTIQQTVSKNVPVGGYGVFSESYAEYKGENAEINGNVGSNDEIEVKDGFVVNGDVNQYLDEEVPDVAGTYSHLTGSPQTGDLSIDDTYNGNIHVTGNVEIEGGSVINGHIVADGNIEVNGPVIINGTLAAAGDIEIKNSDDGTAEINGIIHAEGKIEIKTEADDSIIAMNGTIWSQQDIEVKTEDGGSITIDIDTSVLSTVGMGGTSFSGWKEI